MAVAHIFNHLVGFLACHLAIGHQLFNSRFLQTIKLLDGVDHGGGVLLGLVHLQFQLLFLGLLSLGEFPLRLLVGLVVVERTLTLPLSTLYTVVELVDIKVFEVDVTILGIEHIINFLIQVAFGTISILIGNQCIPQLDTIEGFLGSVHAISFFPFILVNPFFRRIVLVEVHILTNERTCWNTELLTGNEFVEVAS